MALQVQHCVIGDGLEATLLALSLVRLKQTVALVQTTQPIMESHAIAVVESAPQLSSVYDAAHQYWPQLPGYKAVQWRVQGMKAHRLEGGLIQTMTALGGLIREFKGLGGHYLQTQNTHDITLTAPEGIVTGVNVGNERVNSDKTVLANGADAQGLLSAVKVRVPFYTNRCHSVGIAYAEHVIIPPIVIKLPKGHVYIFSDGAQHVQALYAGNLDRNQAVNHTKPDYEIVSMLERLVTALLPQISWQPHDQVRVWLNTISPDRLPLVGRVEGVEGLWLCNGLAEHAAFLAPALAAKLADVLCNRPSDPALNDMMPARIQRMDVLQVAGGEVTKGDERFVDTAQHVQRGEKNLVPGGEITRGEERMVGGSTVVKGEEHLIDGPQMVKGDKRLVDAPQLTKGEERFVDASNTVVRSNSQVALEAEAQVTRSAVKMDGDTTAASASADNKIKMASLKKATVSDKKVTIGSLKK